MGLRRLRVLSVVLFFLLPSAARAASRIAFGGCNMQRLGQGYWEAVAKTKPSLWVWNGDIIYADGMDAATRAGEYKRLKDNAFYKAFRALVPVVGVWDDHDFFADNATGAVAGKKDSQNVLLDFLDEKADSDRRKQEGIYAAYNIGDEEFPVRLLLLDGRYFREAPGKTKDMLGDAQWKWLEAQLSDLGKAQAVFVVSGSQILNEDGTADKWADYPAARDRLLGLLSDVKVPVLLLSGDRHHAEMTRLEWKGRTFVEATSSGLTHWAIKATPNNHRVGQLYLNRNFGTVDFEKENGKPVITVRLRKINGETVNEYKMAE